MKRFFFTAIYWVLMLSAGMYLFWFLMTLADLIDQSTDFAVMWELYKEEPMVVLTKFSASFFGAYYVKHEFINPRIGV